METRYLNNHTCKERLLRFIMHPTDFMHSSYTPAKQKIPICSWIYYLLKCFKLDSYLPEKRK